MTKIPLFWRQYSSYYTILLIYIYIYIHSKWGEKYIYIYVYTYIPFRCLINLKLHGMKSAELKEYVREAFISMWTGWNVRVNFKRFCKFDVCNALFTATVQYIHYTETKPITNFFYFSVQTNNRNVHRGCTNRDYDSKATIKFFILLSSD